MTDEKSPDAAAEAAPKKSASKIIKRYSNRKLYDTERSKYVTLDEIAQMIKAGEEVTIIDNESKEDLTSVTLTQIIFEEEKRESRMPLAMLRNLIQTGGDALQEFLDKSVKTPVSEIKDTAQKSVEELKHGAQSLRDAATRSVTEWTDTARRVFSRHDAEKRAEEFRRAASAAFEELEQRLQARIKDVAAGRVEAEAADAPSPEGTEPTAAPGADAPATGSPARESEHHRGLVVVDLELLREKMATLSRLVEELERTLR